MYYKGLIKVQSGLYYDPNFWFRPTRDGWLVYERHREEWNSIELCNYTGKTGATLMQAVKLADEYLEKIKTLG